jgi:hypothetical protein
MHLVEAFQHPSWNREVYSQFEISGGPHNGYSHNLQSPLKGFRRGYQPRSQTARADRALGPKDRKKPGGDLHSRPD